MRAWFFIVVAGTLAASAGLILPTPKQAHAQVLSPGDLARGHANLEGDQNCARCHSSGRQVNDALCNQCHTDIGASVRAGTGLHGASYRGRPCSQCHVEHRGRDARLTRWPGGAMERFNHADAGWPLHGAHAQQGCRECHSRRNERGAPTFLGLQTACVSCHEDPHENRFGRTCQSCHNEQNWRQVSLTHLDHNQTRFPLHGAHTRVECAECHGTPARYRGIEFQACTSCHTDPHQGHLGNACTSCHSENRWTEITMARNSHPRLSLAAGHADVTCNTCHDRGTSVAPTQGSACVDCHRPVHQARFGTNCVTCHAGIRWFGVPRAIALRAHADTVFPLRGEHEEVACARCHEPRFVENRRYRGLQFDRCNRCHQDVHRGEFAERQGGECARCHNEQGFRPTTFSVQMHRETRFPLEGRHEAARCSGCHGDTHPRLDLHVNDRLCVNCHANPHGNQFAAEMRDGGCSHCHSPLGWNRPNIDHSIWPLTGAHAQTTCDSCHTPSETDRRAGRGTSYRGVTHACEGCHDDIHAGQFRNSAPVRTCDECHSTSTFEIDHFAHEDVTGYPIDGRHREVACTACHTDTTLRNDAHVVLYRLGYRACADCHANPHTAAP
ncbi:MAG: hypothetical protein IPK60_15485 [Sandaracinaceae bacterium]|nr:hypothetical protein [Sandaracinaceae bacterium]